MDKLIYNRTKQDVQYATNNPNSSSFLKGAYNYNDLNRVEEWCEYLKTNLNTMGYSTSFTTKTNWTMDDFPTDAELERIRQNISKLMLGFKYITKIYTYSNKMNYDRANRYEKILWEMYSLMVGTEQYYPYCGVAIMGSPMLWSNRFIRKYENLWENTIEDLEKDGYIYFSDFNSNDTIGGVSVIE